MSEETRETKQSRSFGDEDIAEMAGNLFRPAWIENRPSLWPGVQADMARLAREPRPNQAETRDFPAPPTPVWKWVVAATAIAAAALGLAVFGLRSRVDRSGLAAPLGLTASAAATASGPRVEILASALSGTPARAYVFQTSEASFVWLSPAKKEERLK